jgi:hypothetical protein
MLAVRLKRPLVLKVMPDDSKRTELPLLSMISTLPEDAVPAPAEAGGKTCVEQFAERVHR